MGQFANMLFIALLGWVQTAADWLWGLVTNTDVSAWLRWLLDNWLPLTLLLCLGGAVIDFVVYLLRWQPYRVWGSFLHRMKAKDIPAPAEETKPLFQRRWIYADGSTAVEDVRGGYQEPPVQSGQLEAPIRPVRRLARRSTPEQAYNQPVYPPQWQHNTQEHQGENQ